MPDLATQKLQLPQSQLELAGEEIDVTQFHVEMQNKGGINLESCIVSAQVQRTIQGASSLTVVVDDDEKRTIQRSGRFGRHVDVNINGLWFTFVGLNKVGRQLTLKFEEREVNLLRYYNSFIQTTRDKTTRAQFARRLIEEVREVKLRWIIPELNKQQQVSDLLPGQTLIDEFGNSLGDFTSDPNWEKATRQHGIPSGVPTAIDLYVKSQPATREQISNADTILRTGESLNARRKVLVCSIMTAIDESNIINLEGGDLDSVGVFQQRASQGWPASRNIQIDAAEFFKRAIQLDALHPELSYNDLCQGVQHSGTPNAYGQFRTEAELFVNAYGITGENTGGNFADQTPDASNNMGTNSNGQGGGIYQFTRGTLSQDSQGRRILTKENSWECLQRLATEVNWRCFCVSGVIYFISEAALFQAKPFMVIDEDQAPIQWIDYDYDEGKRFATVTVKCHLSRWSAPPGSIVAIRHMGIVNGRWLVNDISRSLFNTEGEITLKKPMPVLPEPIASQTSQLLSLTPKPAEPAGSRNGGAETTSSRQKQIIDYAKSQLGVPYAWGGDDPGVAFDCSGLTMVAYEQAGIQLSHNAQAQYDVGPLVTDTLQPADLVFFGSSISAIDHVGIYIGNGQMIDAPHPGALVRVDDNFQNWTNPPYVGATRPWAN